MVQNGQNSTTKFYQNSTCLHVVVFPKGIIPFGMISKLTFPECLLCARCYSECQGDLAVNKTDKTFCPHEAYVLVVRDRW